MKRQLCACLGLIRVYAGGGTLIMLKQLEELVAFQRVMVEVKALHEEEAMEVSGGKKINRTFLLVIAAGRPG